MSTSKRTALVTGGNRGIGLAIATGLAQDKNLRVLLAARSLAEGEAAAKILHDAGLTVFPVQLDLASQASVDAGLAKIHQEFNHIDILINNAGVLEQGDALEVNGEAIDHSFMVNLRMPWHLIQQIVPGMLTRQYGRVVNVTSGWGAFSEGLEGPAAYAVSKAALNALTLSLSRHLGHNVKVNSMCPGWVRTRMGGESAPRTPEQGAETAIWLATLPEDGPNGGFFRDKKFIAW